MDHPIRVLQVVTHMNRGGLETMLMNYYRHIDREQVQFDFLVHRHKRAAYDDEIESLGGRIFRLPRLIPWSKTYRQALNAFFQQHPEYKIVHVHQDCLSSIILKAANKHGVPVRIAHSHNASQDKNLKYIIKLFYKQFISKYATDLFACGKKAGDWMFGGAPFKIVNNAIDTKRYQYNPNQAKLTRQALNIPENVTLIGHVGRFCKQKNHRFLISVFEKIIQTDPQAHLLLVGNGERKNNAAKQIKRLGIEKNVTLLGERDDVSDLMQAMDLFIFPSFYEGFPLTLVEAQAAGLPCAISDTICFDCDLTQLIHRLSLKNAPDQWAKEISKHKGTSRAETAAQIAAAGFDIRTNAQQLQDYYLSCYAKQTD